MRSMRLARQLCSTCHLLSSRPIKPGESSTAATANSRSRPRSSIKPSFKRPSTAHSPPNGNSSGETAQRPPELEVRPKPARSAVGYRLNNGHTDKDEGDKPLVRASKGSFLSGLGIGSGEGKIPVDSIAGLASGQRARPPRMKNATPASSVREGGSSSLRTPQYGHKNNDTHPKRKRDTQRSSMVDEAGPGGNTLRSQQGSGSSQTLSSISYPPSEYDDSRVHFIGIDLESSLSRIYALKLPVFRSPSFNIRAYPSVFLPPRRSTPFPPARNIQYRRERLCVYLGLMSSKNAVSKSAVERNRCRRRMKAALDEVVNGVEDLGGLDKEQRMKLVTPEFAYIISLTAESHDVPYDTLKSDILNSLKFLKNAQPRKWNESSRLPPPKYIPRTQAEAPGHGVEEWVI
ncbi:ribonuclease P protein component [Kwoniella sp. CBS 6097]